MAYVHKPGTFSLFKNDKGDNPKRPDYRGDGMDMAGNAIEISAWLKDGAKGKFMSCTFKMKGAEQTPAKRPVPEAGGRFDDMSDDIPF
jgi:hypothetical protein